MPLALSRSPFLGSCVRRFLDEHPFRTGAATALADAAVMIAEPLEVAPSTAAFACFLAEALSSPYRLRDPRRAALAKPRQREGGVGSRRPFGELHLAAKQSQDRSNLRRIRLHAIDCKAERFFRPFRVTEAAQCSGEPHRGHVICPVERRSGLRGATSHRRLRRSAMHWPASSLTRL